MISVCDVVTKAAWPHGPPPQPKAFARGSLCSEGPPLTRVYAVWSFGAAKEGFSGLDIVLRNRAGLRDYRRHAFDLSRHYHRHRAGVAVNSKPASIINRVFERRNFAISGQFAAKNRLVQTEGIRD